MRTHPVRSILFAGLAFLGTGAALAAPPPAAAPTRTRLEDGLDRIAKAAADPSTESRDVLVAMAMESPSARLRAAAADALGRRGDRDDAVGSLVWRWSNAEGSKETALRAAEALGHVPTARASRALWIRREVQDDALSFAVRASWLAVADGATSFSEVAEVARTDPSPRLRVLAVRALARIGGDAAPAALLGAAAGERSALVRDALVEALASLPRDKVEADFRARLVGARRDVRTHLLEVAAGWRPSPSPTLEKAVADALATRAPGPVGAALAATPWTPETFVAARERLGSADPVVRDAATASLVRQLESRPDDAVVFSRDLKMPMAARIALVAVLERIPTEAAREALKSIAKEPVVRTGDLDLVATAVGALRRSRAPGARDTLASLRDPSTQVGALVEALARAQREASRPRAFIVRGRLDRVEEALEALGWEVKPLASANEIVSIDATPEDAILFDGPGEMEAHALAALRRFLHLGGSVVLGAGLENVVWRDLVPDALDRTPPNLRLEAERPGGGEALSDHAVYAASGAAPALRAALEPGPVVMVVPNPVPLRTAAARPLLWSVEMEAANNGVGCVAAEVRMGCGRILALGAVMGLRGTESAEGWFNRVRLERVPGARLPTDEAARRRVAFDWFGMSPGRIAALGDRGYFHGDEPAAGMHDLPAARFVDAWLRLR